MSDKEAIARLAESEEKYRRLFELSEDPMWLILNKKFEICNDAAVSVLGYSSQEELASTHPSELSPPVQFDGVDSFTKAEQMMAAAVDKGYHRFEWVHRKKSGEDFPVEVTLTAIPYEGTIGIYCVWRDISLRKKIETDLVAATAAAEDANRAKSRFLALMSHELRTPLNAVIGYADLLGTEALGSLQEKQKEIVSSIHHGGTLLLNLVNDLLDFGKLESGKFEIDCSEIDAIQSIETSISMLQSECEKRDVTIHWAAQEAGSFMCVGDRLRLEQSIVNVLSNATKYNRPGGNIWVTLEHAADSNRVVISVRDDGCGIHEKDFEAIFRAFERGPQSDGNIEGTGLGLNVTKRLMEAMNGSCYFESTWGKGTTFHLALPAADFAAEIDAPVLGPAI